MPTRSTERLVVFPHPFTLSALDGPSPAGSYWVITEEQQIDGVSFAAWQRTETLLFLPANAPPGKARQVVAVHPDEIAAAVAGEALRAPAQAEVLP